MNRLGVIGTFVWDSIHPYRSPAEVVEQWGGIAYSLSALAAVVPRGWTVVPIIRVGRDLADEARDFLRTLAGNWELTGLREVDEPTNRVRLRYVDESERTEELTGGVWPWPEDELLPLLTDLDALYINYISGFELELKTAERVRAELQVPIYADLHSLCLGPPGEGPRQPRRLAEAERWVRTADYVQVNEAELELVGGESVIEDAGLCTLLITRGAGGAACVRAGSPERLIEIPPHQRGLKGDPTGCGDVWGATVCMSLLAGLSLAESIRCAHVAAGARLGHRGMNGLSEAIANKLSTG